MMKKSFTILLMCAALATGMSWGRQKDQADVAMQAAIRMETVEGNLMGAIEAYRKIADGNNRAIAAKALIRMGQCFEKQGNAEASKAYERVVREFADQKEAVERARALLAVSSRAKPSESGIVTEQKWVLPPGRAAQMRRLSPDGRLIPYTDYSGSHLYLYDLATGEDRLVLECPDTGGVLGPAEISPDGKRMVYTRFTRSDNQYGGRDYELVIAAIDGSNPSILAGDKEKWIQPRAWSPDGRFILMTMARGTEGLLLTLVSVADRSVRELAAPADYSSVCFSPDGRYVVAYRVSSKTGILPGPLKLIPTDGGPEAMLLESSAKNSPPFWAPDGRQIFFLSDRSGRTDLWSIAVEDGKPRSEPRLVRSDVGSIDLLGFAGDGSLCYKSQVDPQWDIYAADLDPGTGLVMSETKRINQRFVGTTGFAAAWSPDGRFFAYTRRAPIGGIRSKVVSIVIRSEATGEEREVVPVPATAFNQRLPFPNELEWFPDGRTLLALDMARQLVFRKIDIETGRVTELLDRSGENKRVFWPELSPDGRTLFYVEGGAGLHRMMRQNLENGEERELYRSAEDVASVDAMSLSSSGRELAFVLGYAGQKRDAAVMILPAEGGSPRELYRSEMSVSRIDWTNDERHLLMQFYPAPTPGPSRLGSLSIEGGELRLAAQSMNLIAVHPDGRRIACLITKPGNEEVWVMKNLLAAPKAPR